MAKRGFRNKSEGNFEKPKNFKKSLGFLLKEIGAFKIALIVSILLAVITSVFAVIGPKILSLAITEIFNELMSALSGGGSFSFKNIHFYLLMTVLLYVVSLVAQSTQGILVAKISQKLCYNLREDISRKINALPYSYFEKTKVGDTLSIIANDIDTLGVNLYQSISQMLTSIVTIIGVVVMMISINIPMTLAVLILLPLSGSIMGFAIKKSQKYFKAQQDLLADINSKTEESINGQSIIKLYSHEEESIKNFNETGDNLEKVARRASFMSGIMFPVIGFVGNLGYVFVSILGGILAFNGRISVGDIQAFIQYSRNFTQPIAQLAQMLTQAQQMMAAAERVKNFLDQSEEMSDESETLKSLDVEKVKGDIKFENISFSYNKERTIINDFSLDVKSGEMVAIVGPTGAGKSTIVKLLMRFYDIDKGRILVDGQNVMDIKRGDIRKCFSMVLQDTWLFHGTIMENIRYVKPDSTDEEVYEACKLACADHFINALPESYNFVLNEESDNISDGEKQLITIARAILSNHPILILDEATSSVDTVTEAHIRVAMNNLMKGRTSFVIAHRLSTIKDANTILLLLDGDIKEKGNHKSLLKKNGEYAKLYNSQFLHE